MVEIIDLSKIKARKRESDIRNGEKRVEEKKEKGEIIDLKKRREMSDEEISGSGDYNLDKDEWGQVRENRYLSRFKEKKIKELFEFREKIIKNRDAYSFFPKSEKVKKAQERLEMMGIGCIIKLLEKADLDKAISNPGEALSLVTALEILIFEGMIPENE